MPALPLIFDPLAVADDHPPTLNGDLKNLPAALAPLVSERRWIVWRWEQTDAGKWTKVPYQARQPSWKASTAAPHTWASHIEACHAVTSGQAHGIGYMLKDAGIAALDLDDCRDPDTGELEAEAVELIAEAGSYVEATVSGTGIRIIGRATGAHVHRKQNLPGSVVSFESYRRATRYIVVTGVQIGTSGLADIDGVIDTLVARLDAAKKPPPSSLRPAPARRDDLPADLDRLIRDGVPRGRRSEEFHHAVGWLKHLGWMASEIEAELAKFPDGIAQKYIRRLGREVQRCFDKASESTWVPAGRAFSDPVAAESQRNLARLAEAPIEKDEREPEANFDARLKLHVLEKMEFPGDPLTPLQLGGTLQWVAEEVLAMSRRPVPSYATMAAIMFGAVLFGRAWRGFTNTSLSLFSVIAGRSGQGKSWPINAVRLLAAEVGLGPRIGGRQPTSDSAIEKRLGSSPCLAYCIDEIGKMFERLGASRAGNHERKVMDIMLELWGQGTMPWSGKDAATPESDRGQELIWYPTLSMFGATTIEPFFRAMNEANVKDGMFARLLIVSSGELPDEVESVIDNFSDDLRNAVTDCWQASMEKHVSVGNLSSAALRSAAIRPHVEKVDASIEAQAAIKEIERWAQSVAADDEEVSGVVNRAAEMTVRLASIRALGRNPKSPMADLGDVKWAWTIVRKSLSFVAYGISRHMAGSEFEAIKKAILRALEKAGDEGLPRWMLFRTPGVKQAEPRHQNAALDSLVETREIDRMAADNKPSRGRPVERFILR